MSPGSRGSGTGVVNDAGPLPRLLWEPLGGKPPLREGAVPALGSTNLAAHGQFHDPLMTCRPPLVSRTQCLGPAGNSLTRPSASCRAQCPGLSVPVGPLYLTETLPREGSGASRSLAFIHVCVSGRGGEGRGQEGAATVTIFSWAASTALFFSGLKDFNGGCYRFLFF